MRGKINVWWYLQISCFFLYHSSAAGCAEGSTISLKVKGCLVSSTLGMNYLIDDEDVTRLYFALKDVSHKEVELCMSQVHPDIVQFPESVNGRVLSYITSITDLNCFNIESGPFVTAVFNTIQEWKAFGVPFALLKKQTVRVSTANKHLFCKIYLLISAYFPKQTNLIPTAQAESAQVNSHTFRS